MTVCPKGLSVQLRALSAAGIAAVALGGCGTKPPKCDSESVLSALQAVFQKNAGPIFQHYVVSQADVFFILRVAEKLKMGMLDDRVTVFFPPGEAEKIKWSFKTVGIASATPEIALCSGHATYSRDDLTEGLDFKFEARATDDGGAYVQLRD